MAGSQVGLAERVASRRRELGLSQAALAGDELSGSYVSLIESGKRVPTAPVLGLLAGRLQTTADYLRDGLDDRVLAERRLQLAHAEIALAEDRPDDALARVALLAGTLEPHSPLHAELRWLSARALERRGSYEEAIDAYEDVRTAGDSGAAVGTHWLEATLGLCRASVAVGDLARAVDLGEEALARVEGLARLDPDLAARVCGPLVTAHRLRGDDAAARRVTERLDGDAGHPLLARAGAYRDASEQAAAGGRPGDAVALAGRALALLGRADDDRAAARVLLARAAAMPAAAAVTVVAAARELVAATGSPRDRAECDLELARLLLATHDVAGARSLVLDVVGRAPGAALAAQGRLLLGACAVRSDPAAGLAAMAAAAGELEHCAPARSAAAGWREVADAAAAAGDPERAAAAYRRALGVVGVVPSQTEAPAPARV